MQGLSPEDAAQISRDTRNVIRSLGRPIMVQLSAKTACPTCGGVDQTTGFPKNPLCPSCGGTGFKESETPVQIQAVVSWGKTNDLQYTQAGRLDVGNCRIEAEPMWRSYFEEGMELVVDGVRVNVVNIVASGFGTISRIIVECEKIAGQ